MRASSRAAGANQRRVARIVADPQFKLACEHTPSADLPPQDGFIQDDPQLEIAALNARAAHGAKLHPAVNLLSRYVWAAADKSANVVGRLE